MILFKEFYVPICTKRHILDPNHILEGTTTTPVTSDSTPKGPNLLFFFLPANKKLVTLHKLKCDWSVEWK